MIKMVSHVLVVFGERVSKDVGSKRWALIRVVDFYFGTSKVVTSRALWAKAVVGERLKRLRKTEAFRNISPSIRRKTKSTTCLWLCEVFPMSVYSRRHGSSEMYGCVLGSIALPCWPKRLGISDGSKLWSKLGFTSFCILSYLWSGFVWCFFIIWLVTEVCAYSGTLNVEEVSW